MVKPRYGFLLIHLEHDRWSVEDQDGTVVCRVYRRGGHYEIEVLRSYLLLNSLPPGPYPSLEEVRAALSQHFAVPCLSATDEHSR